MGGKVVAIDKSARRQLWNDAIKDVGFEGLTIHRSLDDSWCNEVALRRLATRYDRCPRVFLSAIPLAATVTFWL